MNKSFPLFSAFIAPHLDMLRASLVDLPYDARRNPSPREWADAAFYSAPNGLALLHELFAHYLRVDMEASAPEEILFEDFLRLIAVSLSASRAKSAAAAATIPAAELKS